MELKAGNIVKALDFNGIDNCFMIGKVVSVSKEFGDFRAEFIARVWQGEVVKNDKTDFFTAPLQGNLFTDKEQSPRVMVIA